MLQMLLSKNQSSPNYSGLRNSYEAVEVDTIARYRDKCLGDKVVSDNKSHRFETRDIETQCSGAAHASSAPTVDLT